MSDDLVSELRRSAAAMREAGLEPADEPFDRAADEIERLRGENEQLRADRLALARLILEIKPHFAMTLGPNVSALIDSIVGGET